jgi:methionyl aminopeptidase
MAIVIKTASEIDHMRRGGKILSSAFDFVRPLLKVGTSCAFIDNEIRKFIEKNGATPSFLGYRGYKHSSCISVNEEVVHGIPSEEKRLMPGDICSVDIGVLFNGFHVDAARTFPIEAVSPLHQRLIETAERSFFEGIKHCKAGNKLGAVSFNVQRCVEAEGFSVVRDLYSHGVGKDLHEDPLIPNYGKASKGPLLKVGMTLAIEPMIAIGTYEVLTLPDKWTIITADRKWAAHYENTVLVGLEGPEILTL